MEFIKTDNRRLINTAHIVSIDYDDDTFTTSDGVTHGISYSGGVVNTATFFTIPAAPSDEALVISVFEGTGEELTADVHREKIVAWSVSEDVAQPIFSTSFESNQYVAIALPVKGYRWPLTAYSMSMGEIIDEAIEKEKAKRLRREQKPVTRSAAENAA